MLPLLTEALMDKTARSILDKISHLTSTLISILTMEISEVFLKYNEKHEIRIKVILMPASRICKLLIITMHLLQCALYVAFGLDMSSFFEIIIFEFAIEIIKNCTVLNQTIPLSEIETPAVSQVIFMANANNAIPVVRSITVYRFCQALGLKAIHAPSNDVNTEMIQIKPRKVEKILPTPVIYSVTLSKMCEALDLQVELRPENERPTFVNKKRRQAPVVHSLTVFCICQALQLDAQLASVSDQ
ncbi:hypothetical protein TNIN_402691 [Trichonephila inaurata madagascariensis]|uniref:Uncharacterized protein n=1 Tax=Trichonephila inaurata madagascariensis TaxID=2747483 RepID=A0A8X7BVP7_9ARAC|nr:hypothetical protein TNIN_402691 [Trichonephila inaurata madagascariensis]